ncbi:MAG: SecY-interacting protein [Idiomarinaceae bacterium]|uniref:SecY-interacting protein n=1 Tax=Pseudidiomarina aquimaris TaxID=641841 RepID=A0A432XQK6_9GAMM|nr:SecY-interacting protein [Pseudidiomarina aquimaris]MBG23203.1 SecY-interacting protein [Idiomarinaceae bacterium]RUO50978.1 SecY-interacting protein [Pseudidiomarina aquimaris]|tara:strand:- start:278 stop:847 length:570 start_codon:yes stop_codon:yes gene_type:complete
MTITAALDDLIQRYQQAYQDANTALITEANDEWQAPIYLGAVRSDDTVRWQPVRQAEAVDFTDLMNALEEPFHEDFKAYFSRWYSADLAVLWQQHPLWLLHMHCHEDAERMLANQAGHVLMKRRLKQPITLFLGLAEESEDLLITLDNATGAVGLEFVGKPQHETLAASLAEFLAESTPRVVENPAAIG